MFDLADPYSEYESSIPGVTNAEDENGMQQQSVAEPQMMTEEPIQSDNIDTTVTHDGMSQNEPDSQRYEEPFVEANLFEQQLSESKEENLFLHRDESIERDIEDEEERPVIDMLQVAEEQDEAKADQEENQIAEVLKIQTEESNIGETSDFEREDVYDRTKEVYDQREELPMAMQQEIEDARSMNIYVLFFNYCKEVCQEYGKILHAVNLLIGGLDGEIEDGSCYISTITQ